MTTLTPTIHTRSYPAISASRADHSQAGRTVLITGGSKGIGFAIACAFAVASTARIVLVARDAPVLEVAVARLQSTFAGEVHAMMGDLGDPDDSEKLWAQLRERRVVIHVLVLNAARVQGTAVSMLDLGWRSSWELFETNVRGNMVIVEKFMGQVGEEQRPVILNVSSPFVHDQHMAAGFHAYASSKSAFAGVLQHLATEMPQKRVQIISFHPGFIYSDGMKEAGCTPEDLDWDDGECILPFERIEPDVVDQESLPANFAVWAATPKAAFMHGRFAWAKWDVEELEEAVRNRNDDRFLRIGVHNI